MMESSHNIFSMQLLQPPVEQNKIQGSYTSVNM